MGSQNYCFNIWNVSAWQIFSTISIVKFFFSGKWHILNRLATFLISLSFISLQRFSSSLHFHLWFSAGLHTDKSLLDKNDGKVKQGFLQVWTVWEKCKHSGKARTKIDSLDQMTKLERICGYFSLKGCDNETWGIRKNRWLQGSMPESWVFCFWMQVVHCFMSWICFQIVWESSWTSDLSFFILFSLYGICYRWNLLQKLSNLDCGLGFWTALLWLSLLIFSCNSNISPVAISCF